MSTDEPETLLPPPILARPNYRGRYQIIPRILRAFRSKYAPHIGKKQIAKMQAKQIP